MIWFCSSRSLNWYFKIIYLDIDTFVTLFPRTWLCVLVKINFWFNWNLYTRVFWLSGGRCLPIVSLTFWIGACCHEILGKEPYSYQMRMFSWFSFLISCSPSISANEPIPSFFFVENMYFFYRVPVMRQTHARSRTFLPLALPQGVDGTHPHISAVPLTKNNNAEKGSRNGKNL